MKIIYEVGDIVELDDNVKVPHNLATEVVRLKVKSKHKAGMWKVEVISTDRPGLYVVHSRWFRPA